ELAVELAGRLPRLLPPAGEPPGALAGATGLYALLGLLLVASSLPVRRSRETVSVRRDRGTPPVRRSPRAPENVRPEDASARGGGRTAARRDG
ncbi:hypothetical protein, partial [Nonomuraea sp. NPDC050691]|uniref:hypothetical protein n=1 Tax=Nonomuraea sp. NPDC050691 TaxID=3155661 RepID=UPI0033F537C1